MTQKELAAALNLTQQRVGQMVREGMPTDSVEAARTWRKRNVDPTRTKEWQQQARDGYRAPAEPAPLPAVPTGRLPGRGAHSWQGWWGGDHANRELAQCVELVNALGQQAAKHGDVWLETLRKGMIEVPPTAWHEIELDKATWAKLTGDPAASKAQRGTAAAALRYVAACDLAEALAFDFDVNVAGQE